MVDNMEWFNVFGLIFIAVIMIPNVVFAIKCKDGFDNKWNNKYVEVTEQVGRLGCFGFMIINIPGTWFGWWSDEAFALYLIVDTILVIDIEPDWVHLDTDENGIKMNSYFVQHPEMILGEENVLFSVKAIRSE